MTFDGPAFSPDVLNQYLERPKDFTVEETELGGRVANTNDYYIRLDPAIRGQECLTLGFIKRTQFDGTKLLLPWSGDLHGLSEAHARRWHRFVVSDPNFVPPDEDPQYVRALRQETLGDFLEKDE
jgi:hypothetical protein